MSILEINHVSVYYDTFAANKDICFSLQEGECFAIVGESGSGKTTLLRAICGLQDIKDGSIFMQGRNITKEKPSKRKMGVIFQDSALFPFVNVEKNILYGIENKKEQSYLHEICTILGIDTLLQRYPNTLSSGQKQRVGIARALMHQPEILLMDEPFSNLDLNLKETLQSEILELQKRFHITILLVTHDQNEAIRMASRIAYMKDGKILEIGDGKKLYEKPERRETAEFFGIETMNFIPLEEVLQHCNITYQGNTQGLTVAFRRNWVEEGQDFCGVVANCYPLMECYITKIHFGDIDVEIRTNEEYHPGESCSFTIDLKQALIYDESNYLVTKGLK